MNFVWDNANIVESYPGVCSPLTFSFARFVYREVYLKTALLFGVARDTVEAQSRRLETFLGYCDGRFYYNLETWCVLISHLPGFSENPKLLQEMMGVLPTDRIEIPQVRVPASAKLRLLAKALYYHFALPGKTERWLAVFDANFHNRRQALPAITDAHQAMEFFFGLEQTFLRNWSVPILNDFAVMIYSGMLRQLSRRWRGRELSPKQISDIGESGNIRMVSELIGIARAVQDDPALRDQFARLEACELWEHVQQHPGIAPLVERFLAEFGLRNGHDLKLETPNLREDPERFVELLRQYAGAERAAPAPDAVPALTEKRLPLLQNALLDFFVKHTKRSISRREEMRIKRSQIFGMAREVFMKIGADLARRGLIDSTEDIFYLEMEEVFAILRGTATLRDLRVLVAQRRAELAPRAADAMQPHFTTEGIPFSDPSRWAVAAADAPLRELRGSPNYPAVVTGEVLVMLRPDFSQDVRGKIVVCQQTDPSWVPIVALIKGLIVERGGILSHAAIICREFKVPSILGVSQATQRLQSGQRVTLDAVQGTVTIL